MKSRTALTIGALTLLATVAVAHHTTAGIYDIKSEVEVKGKVKEWRFANPHPQKTLPNGPISFERIPPRPWN